MWPAWRTEGIQPTVEARSRPGIINIGMFSMNKIIVCFFTSVYCLHLRNGTVILPLDAMLTAERGCLSTSPPSASLSYSTFLL